MYIRMPLHAFFLTCTHSYSRTHAHMSTGSGRAGVECGDQASPETGVLPGGQGGGCCRGKKAICVYVPVPQQKQFQKMQEEGRFVGMGLLHQLSHGCYVMYVMYVMYMYVCMGLHHWLIV